MFEKFLSLLERIAVALESASDPEPNKVTRPRGRPAKGETPANPEQQAAAQSASAGVAAAATVATPSATASTTDPVVEKVITLQQVADAIIDLANNHSRDAAVAILAANNVKKVPELKPEQFKGVLDAVAKAKAPQTPPSGSAGLF